ncbi:hypothetical protein [Rhizobium paknamense]|uniref:Uncharacterized protein n=1 Tax=Rhizobium paknamense TaxID=1206817 RepID=A0ABU0I907_9HYPH|nr:hypothetical protein [Rhizobium paknamense]MDQ0454721.1 hypothetical protein [Rhizobium paknamense]
MTIPIWPESLPRPERNTWQRTSTDPRIKRPSDSAVPSYRRRFSAVARPVSLSILVSRANKAVFDQFYEEKTGYGTTPFYMPDPTTDSWPLLDDSGNPILTDTGQPILLGEQWLVVFGDQVPTEAIVGVEFRISFSVTVMP